MILDTLCMQRGWEVYTFKQGNCCNLLANELLFSAEGASRLLRKTNTAAAKAASSTAEATSFTAAAKAASSTAEATSFTAAAKAASSAAEATSFTAAAKAASSAAESTSFTAAALRPEYFADDIWKKNVDQNQTNNSHSNNLCIFD